MTRLRLLDEVSWEGRAVTGERSHHLLAVLAAAGGRAVGESDLVDAVWGQDERPAQPGKALQVVVSRTRGQTDRDAVQRVERGYRLGVPAGEVDASVLGVAVRAAASAERGGDLVAARDHARVALGTRVAPGGEETGPLADLREAARGQRLAATAVLVRSASATGEHAEALARAGELGDLDEATLAAVLRSEAAVHGAPVALARYERHRTRVRDTLGVDPGPALQAVHAELLAADNPVREGLRFETTSLVGRDDDLRALRARVRESRVVSILGPGGLGKTRLAHLLGRGAEQPVVHFVELVGVASPDDVVGEVGSALGVRDSVSGRRVLTPEQRQDVRGRIAQQLGQAPTLLILDNCEHVVGAVADLVAFLVAAVPQLRVVTTTRAPLAIAAERVFPLGHLDEDAAVELFTARALAARPGVLLTDDAVRRVVRRLDGLPLAIELAAAKVRAMSLSDIDRRLDDRFTLLRGTDRSAPDRHRTLMAVIDWSWNLLGAPEQRGLARLALFHDGFGLEAAESVLGDDALAVVESLVGQSLLTVREDDGLRYRMLETVREFGQQRLGGDAAAARAAIRAWAVGLCVEAWTDLYGVDQLSAIRAIAAEENNLADTLRDALAEPDRPTVVAVVAALGGAWTIRGEHPRMIAMTAAVEEALAGWDPPEDQVVLATAAAGIVVMNSAIAELSQPLVSRALLDAHGAASPDPRTRAFHRVLSVVSGGDPDTAAPTLASLGLDDDPHTAMFALQWIGHARENAGDVDGAVSAGEQALALWRPDDGIWTRGLLQTQLAGLYAQLGRTEQASRTALDALDQLDALEAWDDAIQLRSVLASAAILDGRLDDAARILAEMDQHPRAGLWGGAVVVRSTRAELALARGEVATGLALYDEAVAVMRTLSLPGLQLAQGREPWTLFAESAAATAHARHGRPPGGLALRAGLAAKVGEVLDEARIDYPVAGCVLFALGAWELRRGPDAELGVRLLVAAERFGYSRYAPGMAWSWAEEECERVAPGALARHLASYGERRGAAALPDARALVEALVEGLVGGTQPPAIAPRMR